MSDPYKLSILKALVDGLKTINPTNGYQSDLSDFDPGDGVDTARVYRGRAFFGSDGDGGGDPVPMVSVLEAAMDDDLLNEQLEEKAASEYWWPLIIQGWVDDDKDNPTDPVYPLLADVRKFLAGEMKRKGTVDSRTILGFSSDYVTGIRFGGGRVRPANELSAYAGFHLLLELRIFDNADNPYG